MPRFTTDFLPLLILKFLSEEEDLWVYRICQMIIDRTEGGYEFKQGTLYPLLRTFERDGLVVSNLRRSPKGPERKCYRLTEEGRDRLQKEMDRLQTVALFVAESQQRSIAQTKRV